MDGSEIPGTTRARSAKALKRLRKVPAESERDKALVDDEWDMRPVIVRTSKGPQECFKIGALAKAWDERTVRSIYKLERNGVIPAALYRKKATNGKPRGDRLYTRAQVELIVALAHAHGVFSRNTRIRFDSTTFSQELLNGWSG